MTRVRVKVCGIVHAEDARVAVDLGVDLVGLNFVPGTPRCLDLRRAEAIAAAAEGAERVAVFQNASWPEIERVIRRIEVERVQLHGDEEPEDVEEIDLPVIKALRGADRDTAEQFPGTILLLDHPTAGGGRGNAWNWSDAAPLIDSGFDVILAGGLTPENVGPVLAELGDLPPWGVDVATGVEAAGHRKDAAKVEAFLAAVRKQGAA